MFCWPLLPGLLWNFMKIYPFWSAWFPLQSCRNTKSCMSNVFSSTVTGFSTYDTDTWIGTDTDSDRIVVGTWAWAWWWVTDVQKIALGIRVTIMASHLVRSIIIAIFIFILAILIISSDMNSLRYHPPWELPNFNFFLFHSGHNIHTRWFTVCELTKSH